MDMLLAAVTLVTVHMIDGREVQVNPKEITRMLSSTGHNKMIPDAVECVIHFTDGTFLSVAETCLAVSKLVEGKD